MFPLFLFRAFCRFSMFCRAIWSWALRNWFSFARSWRESCLYLFMKLILYCLISFLYFTEPKTQEWLSFDSDDLYIQIHSNTLNRTPGISPTAWPFLPNPATVTSSFSLRKLRQPSLGTKAEIFFPFFLSNTLQHFLTAELGCLDSLFRI